MIKACLEKLSEINQAYINFMANRARLENLADLVFWWLLFSLFWAFAWNAHIIGPWVDNLMGWAPHAVDSMRKVEWRRMWATGLCLPGIICTGILYLRNRRK